MEEVFIKKYWDEEDTLFYLHFQDGTAVRQIELSPEKRVFLSSDDLSSDEMLYDQSLEELEELQESDFITREEFEQAWKDR